MKYGDKRTAFNGVFNHVINSYPKSKEMLGFYDGIPKNQQRCRCNVSGLKKFMSDYILTKGNSPSKNYHKNAQMIQTDFGAFVRYCQEYFK